MAKKLTRTVFVAGVAYGPASVIPEDVAKRITNPKAWDDADAPAPAPAGVVAAAATERPAGEAPHGDWTVKELKAFAKDHEVALGEARAKDQILAVLAEAGHGAEPEHDPDKTEDPESTGDPTGGDGDPAEPEGDDDPNAAKTDGDNES